MEAFSEVSVKEELRKLVEKSLGDGESSELISAIKNPKYASCVKTSSWDLISIIIENLSNRKTSSGAQDMLMALVDHASPEEVLLELIEKAESAKTDHCFLALLPAMQRTLARMPETRGRCLQWCLNTISQYLTQTSETNESESEEEAEGGYGETEDQRAVKIHRASLQFCCPLIEEVSLKSSVKSFNKDILEEQQRQRRVLQTFLLQILSQTAANADLMVKETKNPCRVLAEDIVDALCSICSDFLYFLNFMEDRRKRSESFKGLGSGFMIESWEDANPFLYEDVVPTTGLGVLYYLVLVEKVRAEYAPAVYSNLYIFQNIVHVIVGMISSSNDNAIFKGLKLAEESLKSLGRPPLSAGLLNHPVQRKFCFASLQTVFHSGAVPTARLAVSVFKSYLKSFSLTGQYHILRKLFSGSPEQGIRGFLVGQLKDSIDRSLKEHSGEEGVKLFRGCSLFEVIARMCKVDDSAEVGDQADHVIAVLNLFWYLVLCKDSDELGLSSRLEWFEDKMEVLGEAVNKCRAKYEHDRVLLKRENRGEGMKLGMLSEEDELQAVESTINKLILIDSLLTDVDKGMVRWRKND